jgi:hypothetical protein
MDINLNDLLKSGGNITVAISITDLRLILNEAIQDTRRELEEIVISEKAETYPTPKQVSEILNVDTSTLWRWKKRSYLVPIEIGGKRRYRMSDVKALLNGRAS